MKHIVILGGGFGGLAVFLYLKSSKNNNFHVTLIDKNDYHLYYATLYEIAAALIKEEEKSDYRSLIKTVAIPFDEISKNDERFKIIMGKVTDISFIKNEIIVKDKGSVKYDYLIIALGSETNYFGIPGAIEYSMPFKGVYEALNIRNQIEEVLYKKGAEDPQKEIRIIIAGGGFSGCELAGELIFFLNKFCKREGIKANIGINIVEASSTILPGARKKTKELVKKRLKNIGINLILNSRIKEVEEKSVIVDENRRLDFDILIWTAGIDLNRVVKNIKGAKLEKGFLLVNQYLQVEGLDNVFAIGDCIYLTNEEGVRLPATAYYAVSQGKVAALNIINLMNNKSLKVYRPRTPVFAIPLGSKYAVVDLNFIIITGLIGWFIRHLVTLKYFLSILPLTMALRLWVFSLRIFIKND